MKRTGTVQMEAGHETHRRPIFTLEEKSFRKKKILREDEEFRRKKRRERGRKETR